MFSIKNLIVYVLMVLLALGGTTASAKISAGEAEKLKSELTPLGAERAGNADGTIPAWSGTPIEIPASYKGPGAFHPDPFADDKPLFVITAKNMSQYADKLTEGQQAMFKTYPNTYKMSVYKTRRTATFADWYYKNTYNNAIKGEVTADGNGVTGCWGGIPFPIPKNGLEVLWNHNLRYRGIYRFEIGPSYAPDVNGKYYQNKTEIGRWYPYYDPKTKGSQELAKWKVYTAAPQRMAGDMYIINDHVNMKDNPRQAWRYFAGQRRVRRAPVLAYDTPLPPASGQATFDDFDGFLGAPDRFEWKLIGKKEIYIPYNCYQLDSPAAKTEDVIKPGHINPEFVRYELHRVWVVEGNLREGSRHIYSRRVLFIDEDSWWTSIADTYDERGDLWRSSQIFLMYFWDMPGIFRITSAYYDTVARRYFFGAFDERPEKSWDFNLPTPPANNFLPASLRRGGVR
jgi:Protein of unknown function (DUF1329)